MSLCLVPTASPVNSSPHKAKDNVIKLLENCIKLGLNKEIGTLKKIAPEIGKPRVLLDIDGKLNQDYIATYEEFLRQLFLAVDQDPELDSKSNLNTARWGTAFVNVEAELQFLQVPNEMWVASWGKSEGQARYE
jgi:hypothetical protein